MCVFWISEEHARLVLEEADCIHCKRFRIHDFQSRSALPRCRGLGVTPQHTPRWSICLRMRRSQGRKRCLQAISPPQVHHRGGNLPYPPSLVGQYLPLWARHMRQQVRLVRPCTPWCSCRPKKLTCIKIWIMVRD